LQPRGKVRRLADHAALLRFAAADQSADDHRAGADADADLEVRSSRFSAQR
jgi:hypothetical protein